ncbi:MAG: mechanosensitive ion channel [Tannerella sp.]|nr:mechanosensitive ion channel [Tannerella sp.]
MTIVHDLWIQGAHFGLLLVKAALILLFGRLIMRFVDRLIRKLMDKRGVEPSVKTFLISLSNVLMVILIAVSIVGALGVQTTSFAALLASAGVAIGMALSGNLSNFSGGLMILLFKPFKVGDSISAQGMNGTVKEIQIFHTVLVTGDNKRVYIPNGALSSGTVVNLNVDKRRVEWIIGVDYGTDFQKAKALVERLWTADARILKEPAPFIALQALADSSVNLVVRVWVEAPDYWGVYFDMNRSIYEAFNAAGISFPYPQLTVHQGS